MGADFVALVKYRGPDARLAEVLTQLEKDSPEELKQLRRIMDARGFAACSWGVCASATRRLRCKKLSGMVTRQCVRRRPRVYDG